LAIGGTEPLRSLGVQTACRAAGIEVVGAETERDRLLALWEGTRPDVIVSDAELMAPDPVATVERLADQGGRILLFVGGAEVDHVALLRAGASGFVARTAADGDLVASIERVVAGDVVVDGSLARRLFDERQDGAALPHLTAREREVLRLAAAGKQTKEIAAALHMSGSTVKTHVRRAAEKLETRSRTAASCRALQLGLLDG
jgi:DNA-binding NarL/FixJ family response regulator